MFSNKYRNIKTTVAGMKFDSRREARRFEVLMLMERGGVISNLHRQKRWPLEVNGMLVAQYVSDFDYIENGKYVVEDCKGVKTPVYLLKKKLMLALHGIEIVES